mgnify:CR=1 FL=1
MLHPSIQTFLPQIITLFQKHKIRNAFVFGSALTDNFNLDSDVDFLVNLQDGLDPVDAGEHLWDLEYELKDLLNRNIDLLTERSLKNPYFISEVNATKYSIYGQVN